MSDHFVRLMLLAVLASSNGCHRLVPADESQPGASQLQLTPTNVRAERRLYDGAPPVIPHKPLNISCTQCHTSTGREAPPLGFAPANPHAATRGISGTSYCQQCHVFRRSESTFNNSPNDFSGLSQHFVPAERLYPGAPPVIPHRVFMRENCASCHSGPAARLEIVCRHIQRANCRQCHVPQTAPDDEAAAPDLAASPFEASSQPTASP